MTFIILILYIRTLRFKGYAVCTQDHITGKRQIGIRPSVSSFKLSAFPAALEFPVPNAQNTVLVQVSQEQAHMSISSRSSSCCPPLAPVLNKCLPFPETNWYQQCQRYHLLVLFPSPFTLAGCEQS